MTTTTLYPEYTQTKEPNTGITVSGNFTDGDTTKMTIDPEGTKHIMQVLSSLYSNPIPAVIREYASNGLDAQTAIGVTTPVNLVLPATLRPVFQVVDHGIGMTPDELRNVYARYGKSTKTLDMSQVGTFGLGCKAAFSVTPQFTVNTVKNGVQSVAIIKRGEDGVGELTIVSIEETDRENGTTVNIPVDDIAAFKKGVAAYAYYAKPGTITIDSSDNYASFYSEGEVFELPDLKSYYAPKHEKTGYFVVSGGVAYRVRFESLAKHYHGLSRLTSHPANMAVYSEIPIGAIDLVPSRDDIQYTPRTNEFLTKLADAVYGEIVKDLLAKVEKAPDRLEAILAARRLKKYNLNSADIKATWHGEEIPAFERYDDNKHFTVILDRHADRTKVEKHNNIFTQMAEESANGGIVTYYLVAKKKMTDAEWEQFTQRTRRQFLSFIRVKRESDSVPAARLFVFADEPTHWVTEVRTYKRLTVGDLGAGAKEWRSISARKAAMKKTFTHTNPPTIATPQPIAQKMTYPVLHIDNDGKITSDELPAASLTENFFYFKAQVERRYGENPNIEWQHISSGSYSKFLLGKKGLLGRSIVFISYGRDLAALFKRTGFTLVDMRTHADAALTDAIKNMPEQHKKSLGLKYALNSSSYIPYYNAFFQIIKDHKNGIEDTELVSLAELWYASSEWDSYIHKGSTSRQLHAVAMPHPDLSISRVIRKYPLLVVNYFTSYPVIAEHIVHYLNTSYSKFLKGNEK